MCVLCVLIEGAETARNMKGVERGEKNEKKTILKRTIDFLVKVHFGMNKCVDGQRNDTELKKKECCMILRRAS